MKYTPNERPAQCYFQRDPSSPPPSCGFVGITSLMLVVEVVATAVVISCGKYHDIHNVYSMCIYIYIIHNYIDTYFIYIDFSYTYIIHTPILYVHWVLMWDMISTDIGFNMYYGRYLTYTTEIWFLEWCHWPQITSPWLGLPSNYGSLWWNGGATCTWHHGSKQFWVQLQRRHHPCPFQTAAWSPPRWPFFWVGAMEHHQNEPWKRAGWVKIQDLGTRGPQIDWSIVSTISPPCKHVLIQYIYIYIYELWMCLVRCFSCCLGCPWPSTFSIWPCCFSFSLLVHLSDQESDLIRLDSYPKYIHSSVEPHRDGRSTICKSHPHVTHCFSTCCAPCLQQLRGIVLPGLYQLGLSENVGYIPNKKAIQ